MDYSEGKCPACGQPLGISGSCLYCAAKDMPSTEELARRYTQRPTCRQCGGPMVHTRRYGYLCARNLDHQGIIWPHQESSQA